MTSVAKGGMGCGALAGAALLISTSGAATAGPPGVCAHLAHEVRAEGAKAVVGRLFNSPGHRAWEALLDRVQTGRARCIALAGALRGGTDAATGEGLRIALSRTLQTNPAAVLALGDQAYPLRELCRDNDIEPTPAQARAELERTRAALAGVEAPALIAKRDACLRALGR